MSLKLDYRRCVVAVFTNSAGEILVGERSDVRGAWQLPQGGIDPGESSLEALYREMKEELGCNDFEVLNIASREVTYRFPENLPGKISTRYCGQTQQWYLTKFRDGKGPRADEADGEFAAFGWQTPKKVLAGIVAWKQDAYRKGFQLLNIEVE